MEQEMTYSRTRELSSLSMANMDSHTEGWCTWARMKLRSSGKNHLNWFLPIQRTRLRNVPDSFWFPLFNQCWSELTIQRWCRSRRYLLSTTTCAYPSSPRRGLWIWEETMQGLSRGGVKRLRTLSITRKEKVAARRLVCLWKPVAQSRAHNCTLGLIRRFSRKHWQQE